MVSTALKNVPQALIIINYEAFKKSDYISCHDAINDPANWMRIISFCAGGKPSTIRFTVPAAPVVCSVEKTRCPVSAALTARRPFAINREVLLKVITHNLMIIRRLFYSFQRSRTVPI